MNEAESTAINALLGMMQADTKAPIATKKDETVESSLKRRISSFDASGLTKDGTVKVKRNRTHESPSLPFTTNVEMSSDAAARPRVIQVCVVPKTHVDHTYWDMSHVGADEEYVAQSELEKMNFHEKLHQLLSRGYLVDYIAWMPHGRAFCINKSKRLEGNRCKVLKEYLGISRQAEFVKQLMKNGFKPLTQGKGMVGFYNQFFLQGLPHLCKFIVKCEDGHRLKSDPDNEPDLEAISQQWPLLSANVAASSLPKGKHSESPSEDPYTISREDMTASGNMTDKSMGSVAIELTKSPISVISEGLDGKQDLVASSEIFTRPLIPRAHLDDLNFSKPVSAGETMASIVEPQNPSVQSDSFGGETNVFLSALLLQQQMQQLQQQQQLQHQQQAQNQAIASHQSQSQAQTILESMFRTQAQPFNEVVSNKQPTLPEMLAAAMLTAEVQRMQQEQASTFVASFFRNAMMPQSQPQQIQTAGTSSSEAGNSALSSVLTASLLQAQASNKAHSFR